MERLLLMTKHKITQRVSLSISGSKIDLKVTPRYPLESVRQLDTKGTKNAPHAHVKPSWLKRLIKGETK